MASKETSATAETTKAFISAFTPSRTKPEDLEQIFVQRDSLLQDAVERMRESALTGHKHHLLFAGPRGCGKTHFVTLLVHRLGKDTDLAPHLHIAWLNEDETSTTILELMLRVYHALVKRYPDEYSTEGIEPAFGLAADEARTFVSNALLTALSSRTLMVVVENLDDLFEGLGDRGQKELRSFIQEHPVFSLVATAQRLEDNLTKRTSPFFGFFQTEHLKPLSVDEAAELLQKIAALNKQNEVAAFLRTSRGKARVRALHHLSGGNHRIYIVLSQFITRNSIDALVDPFCKMVDELTPYYQERIRWLPPLQRKIMEFLCASEGTNPVKEIAKRLFATHQTISNQLKDLREKGYVLSSQRGRESLYEISEPLMRLCVEVKENQTHQPLRLRVDFLRVWYDDRDLTDRLEGIAIDSIVRPYLESAIEQNAARGNPRKKLLADDVMAELSAIATPEGLVELTSHVEISEELGLAFSQYLKGDFDGALQILEEMEHSDTNMIIQSTGLVLKLRIHVHLENYLLARAIATQVLDLAGTTPFVVGAALTMRGVLYSREGKHEEAVADFTAATDIEKAPNGLRAVNLSYRANEYGILGDSTNAMGDYMALCQTEGANAKHVVDAHFGMAKIHARKGRWQEALEALDQALLMNSKAPSPDQGNAKPFVNSIFVMFRNNQTRKERIAALARVYSEHNAISALGEGLVQHLESLYLSEDGIPDRKNLGMWADAWSDATKDIEGFRIPLRVFRTGIQFLQSGGEDRGVLLDLAWEEREILRQALGLSKDEGSA